MQLYHMKHIMVATTFDTVTVARGKQIHVDNINESVNCQLSPLTNNYVVWIWLTAKSLSLVFFSALLTASVAK